MDPDGTAPPAAESCLVSSDTSRGQRGGTIIDETVLDLATHQAWMLEPGLYRPKQCPCGCERLHVHDRRDRHLRGAGEASVLTVMVFICARCSATWRVLPAFLARCLWRTWATVEGALLRKRRPDEPKVPLRTQQRWRARLAQAARVPAQVLASSGSAALRSVAQGVGLDGCRRALIEGHAATFVGAGLTGLAALLHRLSPGIRLM